MANIIDTVADLLGLGPNSWDERLKPTIDFTSPDGNKYTCSWIGNDRTKSKKLGLFDYPKVKGTIVQDLGSVSTTYPITLYFHGRDNDIESDAFFESCSETGTWAVTHPVHGFIELQLVDATQKVYPIESGNITVIDTNWIEPIDEKSLTTARELASKLSNQKKIFNAQAIMQFSNRIRATADNLKSYVTSTTNLITNASEVAMSPLSATNDSIFMLQNATIDGINDTMVATVFRPTVLGGQFVSLIQGPALANMSISSRLDAYDDLIGKLKDTLIRTANETGDNAINNSILCEVAISACIGAQAEIVTTGELVSRTEAIGLATRIADMFDDATDALDGAQDDFVSNPIDRQYFSQSEAYADAMLLVYQAIQYLVKTSFDLKIEKRFTITRDRAPIEITISEYGTLGDADEMFDFFISTNALEGFDILLLPAGREVVVYV